MCWRLPSGMAKQSFLCTADRQCLVQAHMGRITMPIADYVTDLRGVADNALRVLHAFIDTAAEARLLSTTLVAMRLIQALSQVQHSGLMLILSCICMRQTACCTPLSTLQQRHACCPPRWWPSGAPNHSLPGHDIIISCHSLTAGRNAGAAPGADQACIRPPAFRHNFCIIPTSQLVQACYPDDDLLATLQGMTNLL